MRRSRLMSRGLTREAAAGAGKGSHLWTYALVLLAGVGIIALAVGSAGSLFSGFGPTTSHEFFEQQGRRRLEENKCECPPLTETGGSERPFHMAVQEGETQPLLLAPEQEPSSSVQAEGEECDTLAACQGPIPSCGVIDACGQKIFCGGCAFPEWCGGGGVPNKCGCKPRTCSSLRRTCGEAPDGCGGILSCGEPCTPWEMDPVKDTRPPFPERPYRVGYWSSKAQFRPGVQKYEVEDVDARWFTHVIFSSAGIDPETLALVPLQWNDDDINKDFVAKGKWRIFRDMCHVAGAVPMLSIGGEFIDDKEGDPVMNRVVQDEEDRKALVESISEWLLNYKFEGIEFDWTPTTSEGASGLQSLLIELRDRFDSLSLKTGKLYWLSVKVPADPAIADVAFPDKLTLSRVVDWISVSTELIHVWEQNSEPFVTSQAGIHDEFGRPSIATAVAHWRRSGVPPHSLVITLSTIAAVWELKDESEPNYGAEAVGNAGNYEGPMVPYIQLADELPGWTARDILHVPTSTAYAYSANKWASYDSPASVVLKVDYVVQQKLGGYMLCVDQDAHHELAKAASDRMRPTYPLVPARTGQVMLVTSGKPKPCDDADGTLFMVRSLKNKLEYAQRHGFRIKYNHGNWNGDMAQTWSKLHMLKNALLHHPEVEWFLWMDDDALFTDMSFEIPFEKYRYFNLVVPGYWKCLYEDSKLDHNRPKWTCLNSGVFLIRNCGWSLHLLDLWMEYGSPLRAKRYGDFFAQVQLDVPKEQLSNDQSALIYLLHNQRDKIASLTFFEESYSLHGFWADIVAHFEHWMRNAAPRLRWDANYRPAFITHFTGCEICGGRGIPYDKDVCVRNMKRALNFGDNQALLPYNMSHVNLLTPTLQDL